MMFKSLNGNLKRGLIEREISTALIACPPCEKPLCTEFCPVDALSKDETTGVIKWNGNRCIHCHLCAAACPHDSIRFEINTDLLIGKNRILAAREEEERRFDSGHGLCAGCGIPIVIRTVLNSIKEPVVVACATGCLEVATTSYPYTTWNVPWIHNAFENAAATISGIETAYRVLKKKGKIGKEIKFVAFGGDGGTYDIGLQSLSGALERGHNFLYICYDNEAYMNTGNQRSSATPIGAFATTEPPGERSFGKRGQRKDLTEIIAAHHIPYAAQASIFYWQDLSNKVEKAISKEGPTFINVLSPCPLGWGYDPSLTMEMAKLAVETNFWPIYEVEDEVCRINYKPKRRRNIKEWLKPQRRFAHLFNPGNEEIIEVIQKQVDDNWQRLLKRCKEL